MLTITIPDSHVEERRYAVRVVFEDFLRVEHRIVVGTSENYRVALPNGQHITVRDAFFSRWPAPLSFLTPAAIPDHVALGANAFAVEKDLPILFGDGAVDAGSDGIACGVDLFAGIFFMLTRWEEHVAGRPDRHQRVRCADSVAARNGFLGRPVVNEYVEMLRNMLLSLGYPVERRPGGGTLFLTHDVDFVRCHRSAMGLGLRVLADLLNRRKFTFFARLSEFRAVRSGAARDPFDTFDWLMDLGETAGTPARFYFMSGEWSRYDVAAPYCERVLRRIRERGHVIGFHPGEGTCDRPAAWVREKARVERAAEMSLTEGRQHRLSFRVPRTWQIWDENRMQTDSSLYYREMPGFRCGTGNEYPVFNFLTRQRLTLKERPLVFMDGTLRTGDAATDGPAATAALDGCLAACRKYGMPCTVLFHNSSFDPINWPGWDGVYSRFIADAAQRGRG